ncbi:18655_t:CDS:1, partial [Racocetra persica]
FDEPYYPSNNLFEDFKKNYAVAVFDLRTSIMALKLDLSDKYGSSISDIVNSTNSVEEVTMKFLLDHNNYHPLLSKNPKGSSPASQPSVTESISQPTIPLFGKKPESSATKPKDQSRETDKPPSDELTTTKKPTSIT